jgi:hypothetical protein
MFKKCKDCNKSLSRDYFTRCRSCANRKFHRISKKGKMSIGLANKFRIRTKKERYKMRNSKLGNKHPNYKIIGTIKLIRGYRIIKVGNLNWKPEHRYIVENYICRKLKKTEQIHHIDGNKLNNKLSNLYICKNIIIHLSIEMLIKYKVIDRFYIRSNLKEFKYEKN